MAVPLRKDRNEEELTTADLAQGPRSAEQRPDTLGPRPVVSEKNAVERPSTPAEDATPLFRAVTMS